MSRPTPKWAARIVVLRRKITLPGLIEAVSLYLVFIGVSHFSQAFAYVVVGTFGIWLTESGNS